MRVQGRLPVFPDGELGVFACLGAVTDRSVRVWLRDPSLQRHEAELRTARGQSACVVLAPDAEHDAVAAGELTLDRPEPDAEFVVTVAGMTRRGRLAPAEGAPAAFAFGVGSCSEPFSLDSDPLERRPQADFYDGMRQTLAAEDARFLALIGDQVYADKVTYVGLGGMLRALARRPPKPRPGFRAPPPPPESGGPKAVQEGVTALLDYYRRVYRGYFNERGFRSLLEHFPTYLMWDDHELTDNWGSRPGGRDERLLAAASRAYLEYQHLHNPGSALSDGPSFPYAFWQADTGFFVLDMRGARDYDAARVMDPEQWDKLRSFLDEASERNVPTLFIVATVPLVHFAPALVRLACYLPGSLDTAANARDRWNSGRFKGERNRLLGLLFDWQAARAHRQVVLLSGDVHAAAAFRVRRRNGPGELVQWTASAMTAEADLGARLANRWVTRFASWGDDACRVRREHVETGNNFGVVHVTPRPSVTGAAAPAGHDVSLRLFRRNPRTGRPELSFTARASPRT